MAPLLLVRYGELTLKSPPVRREFERTLRRNVLTQFASADLTCRLRNDMGHLYVEVDDAGAAARVLRRVFGITSVSEVVESTSDPGDIIRTAVELLRPVLGQGATFAVRGRRTGQHPYTSQELAAKVGEAILDAFADRQPRVDLGSPLVELAIEVRDRRSYLSTGRVAGPGGLPLGVAGSVVALVDGHRAGLGAYLMMKRGCRCALVPVGDAAAPVTEILRRFDPGALVASTAADAVVGESEVARLAQARNADAVALPLAVESFPEARALWGDRVVFSPTVGLSDEEVETRWAAVEALAG